MLEEEYAPRRVKPFHLRRIPPPEPDFAYEIRAAAPRDLPDVREIYNYYVTNSVVTFKSWCKCTSHSRSSWRIFASTAPNGSSSSNTEGFGANARAIATRCR